MRIRWRGLELPTRVVKDESLSTPNYGKFMIEPFEKGFGTTVGNSLRRILLSSLEGAAVTQVRIKGADHEFTTLPGVMEDIAVIILNVKSLVVRLNGEGPKTMRVNVRGQKGKAVEVRASDIQADPAIDIINKDQLLATLTEDVEFSIEMTVAHGRSYATADENKPAGEDQIIGIIYVDSVFSPVTRVRYRVEDTRVGQRTNYDRLVMEIWTNGTLTPEMALVEAAKILRKHLNALVQYFELGGGLAARQAGGLAASAEQPEDERLAAPVSTLDLSVRSSNCLASASITTIGQLVQMDEASLLQLRSFGKTSLMEVKSKLTELGLSLRGDTGEGMSHYSSDQPEMEGLDPFAPHTPTVGGLDPFAPGNLPSPPAGAAHNPENTN
jgi:DNA-directed RNA polymerase subunit alpha